MPGNDIFIRIKAVLDKMSEVEFKNALDSLEQQAKPIKIKVDTDAEAQIKLHKSLQKIYKEEERQRLLQEKYTTKALADKEKQLQYEQKVRIAIGKSVEKEKQKTAEIQSQLNLYKQKMLGGDGFRGELDIFASKQKGRFDESALAKIKSDVASLTVSTPDLQNKTKQLTTQFSSLKQESSKTGSVLLNAMENAGKFMRFYLVGGALVGFTRSIKDGISSVIELNKSLTEISIVTGLNQKEVAQLGKEYQELGKSMNVSASEIATGATEFYRQGLTQEEVMERLSTTTQYAKISALGFSESAEILTATVNSMGISIERASDVFAYLGDATATGADEIGRAFQRVGGTAGALGVEFEKVSSWIAVVSSKTRESAESIGNSMKTILARIQNMKKYGFDEEDGTKVNEVARALNEAGIALIDSTGQFRNLGTVMDELGETWSTLDSRQKAYVATTVAGVRQQSRFLNLMESYAESVELYEQSLLSAGATQEKFALWQEGLEAQINDFKNATEGLWMNLVDSGTIAQFINIGTTFTETLDVMANKTEYLGVALTTLSAIAVSKVITSMTAIQVKAISLGTTITVMTGGLNILLGVLTLATVGFGAYSYAQVKAEREKREFIETTELNIQKTESELKSIEKLSGQYENLEDKIGKTEKSKKELDKIISHLIKVNPDLVDGINGQKISYENLAQAIQLTINKQNELIGLNKKSLRDTYVQELQQITAEKVKYLKMLDQENKALTTAKNIDSAYTSHGYNVMQSAKSVEYTKERIEKIKNEIASLDDEHLKVSRQIEALYKDDAPSTVTKDDVGDDNIFSGTTSSTSSTTTKTAPTPYQSKLEDYINTLQLISEKEQEITEVQKQKNLVDEQDRIPLIQKEIDLQNKLIDLNSDLADQQKQTRQSLADQFSAFSDVVKVSDDLETLTVNTDEYNKKSDKQKENLDNLISSFTNLNKSINSSKNAMYDAQIATRNLNDEMVKQTNSVADKVIDIYKKMYEQQKQSKLKAIEAEMDAEEKRHKRILDNLQEELDEFEETVNKKLKILDRESNEEDFSKQLSKLQQEKSEIQNQINVLSLDDSIEARARVFELNQQLANKEEEIEELKVNRTRELRKNNLQDELETYKKEINEKQNTENKKYEAIKNRLQLEKEATTTHYDNLINDERMYAQIREDIINGHLDSVLNDLGIFAENANSKLKNVGDSIRNNLLDSVRAVKAELNSLSSSTYSSGYSGSSTNTHADYINKTYSGGMDAYNSSLDRRLKEAQNSNDFDLMQRIIKEKQRIGVLHDGGIIGGKSDKLTEAINKLFNVKPNEQLIKGLKGELYIPPQNIMKNFVPNINKLMTSTSSANGGNAIYNLNLSFDNFRGSKQDGENVFNIVANGLKRMGKK